MEPNPFVADPRSGDAEDLSYLSELLYFDIHSYFDVEPIFCFAVQRVCNMSVESHIDYKTEL